MIDDRDYTWVGWILAGTIGLVAMTIWEVAKYYRWFPWQSVSRSAVTNEVHDRIHIAMSPEDRAELDDWRRRQTEIPSRAEAIRALIRAGLKATKPVRRGHLHLQPRRD